MKGKYHKAPVLVMGSGRLVHSVAVGLLQAEHPVTLVTKDIESALTTINEHVLNLFQASLREFEWDQLKIASEPDPKQAYELGIAITSEDAEEKRVLVRELEKHLLADAIIGINTEGIPLSTLQEACDHPGRLIGVNWVEPAHTTYFLELITNEKTNKALTGELLDLAKMHWSKDPYLVSNDVSIRSKMLGAMVREAFFLVQNGYASIEDIDRACRNDPGYYLPFSGNFRYMDLMGTYAYGLVMKDLNRELSNENAVPVFFQEIIEQGGLGMENNKGFYEYGEGDAQQWKERFSRFSYQIQEIINKYPFNFRDGLPTVDPKTPSI